MQNNKYLNGVNLGGWLLLEKWMTPSIFKGIDADDEYTLCKKLGAAKIKKLKTHRESFITEQDFKWIKENGYKAVRLPLGYWALEDKDPYVSTLKYVDFAFKMCTKYQLKIILQLHGAPGSQNGTVHSGRRGQTKWHQHQENIDETVEVLKKLAKRYGNKKELLGIGLLNEPSQEIPRKILREFYQKGCNEIEPNLHQHAEIYISSRFKPIRNVRELPNNKRVVMDSHYYHLMSGLDKRFGSWWHFLRLATRLTTIYLIKLKYPTIIGEYTRRLPRKIQKNSQQINKLQDFVYSKAVGKFYWSYKTETNDKWSLRHLKGTDAKLS